MSKESCEACGRAVTIAGGVANLWDLDAGHGGGMTLELDDGTERFLCFECLDTLPESATTADVDALDSRSHTDHPTPPDVDESDVSAAIPAGLTIGALLGAGVGIAVGDVQSVAWVGATVGVLFGLVWPRLRS